MVQCRWFDALQCLLMVVKLEAPEDERKILELIVDFKSNWE